ncbi:hypothetical protein SKAU_G00054470 [Synaphobranchus kaupii]|uniref:Uncharacterized protein n=1 Tax=Synaphobranchus kaupii TaxID=118154 RepID=A0A9Q1JA40_SYNKA|nr:hypothetical protein SKAU_G00054470 [Synaphobranchus kaupii]
MARGSRVSSRRLSAELRTSALPGSGRASQMPCPPTAIIRLRKQTGQAREGRVSPGNRCTGDPFTAPPKRHREITHAAKLIPPLGFRPSGFVCCSARLTQRGGQSPTRLPDPSASQSADPSSGDASKG